MSQSNIYIDIGNSAVKWRTLESDVYSKNVDEFLISTLPQADSAWVSAVANLDIVEDLKRRTAKYGGPKSARRGPSPG